MRRLIVSFTLVIGAILPGKLALALTPRAVYLHQLSGLKLHVWSGHGLTLNFLPASLIVRFASLGHPGQFTLSSDGSLCPLPVQEAKKACSNTGANVLFTRLIGPKPLEFPGLQPSADGSTQLSLIVQMPNGEKKAVPIELVPGRGQPEYGQIDVIPDSQKPTPLFVPSKPSMTSNKKAVYLQPHTVLSSNSVPSRSKRSANQEQVVTEQLFSSIDDANAIAFGLLVANHEHQIRPGTRKWGAVQRAIAWLRRGYSREEAARRAGLKMPFLNQLIGWGQNRP